MTHPLLLEINTRCWLRSLSEAEGRTITLANVPEAQFGRWRSLGLTHIWLMGVWRTGPRSRAFCLAEPDLRARFRELLPGSADDVFTGSPYAIADYSVASALGGETGLKAFRERLNQHGMKLVLDFIANHPGLDHPWVAQRPELFVQSAVEAPGTFTQSSSAGTRWFAHGRDPYFPPWRDTVQLDYRRADTRAAMLGELRSVARQCDGVRCDLAMLQLNDVFATTWARFPGGPMPATEFWADAISSIKSEERDFLFLAESYWDMEARLQSLGFDYTYDKRVYDFLVERRAIEQRRRLAESTPGFLAASAHFLENHDEARIATVLSPAEHRAAALLTLGLPGMRLLYEGQMEGRTLRVPVQFARWPDEPVNVETRSMYEQMLAALKESSVGRGEWRLPRIDGSLSAVAVQWQASPGQFDLVVVNPAATPAQCRLWLEIPNLAVQEWEVHDVLGDGSIPPANLKLPAGEFSLELPAHAAKLIRFRAKS